MNKSNQYFMYGILVPFKQYLELDTGNTVEDVLKVNDGIQGIFTGRNNDFMIVGKVLPVKDDGNPQVVPELDEFEIIHIKTIVNQKYGLYGEFHYYFITL